jgi:transcriptional regulator with PAS, ATPase and Fis domain
LFEVADGGTIFLDEIGEVSQATQVQRLRVLDSSTFRHVGGTVEIRVDARVIAATNRDLLKMVRQGLFREDLFYRLSTITVELPPLRERSGDVELLARHFADRLNERYGFRKTIGAEAMELLRRHDWPGNVRELLNVIEAAIVVGEGVEIQADHLPPSLRGESQPDVSDTELLPTLQELERQHIQRALRATGGHRGNAAEILGISERNLYRKLKDNQY